MELIVGDKINKRPGADDIARAIDGAAAASDFSITLDAGHRGSLDAYAESKGGFSVVAAATGRTYRSARPVDAVVLKSLFLKYLKGDASWRQDCEWASEDELQAEEQAIEEEPVAVDQRRQLATDPRLCCDKISIPSRAPE